MTKNECFNLGYISKRIGNKGELAFVLDVDNPNFYNKLKSVFVERNNTLVPFFIQNIQLRGTTAVVSIEGIDTIDKAEEIVKSGLYLPLSSLPPLSGKKFYFHEIVGYTAIDKVYGELGLITGVLDFPQQIIFQIKHKESEILIPAKEEFIISIDREIKRINLNAPEGLIDIYIGEKEDLESEIETDLD